ncbi:FAD-binding and (Fe-S)-binding domain-containing protein [Microvirga lenta]|uniref:FAD-binding and (Fe-S)-binding domain-containing protein n=1 Tax=Microvirga lenta TaxID=2881337 RepID=UPI001CFF6560|nr:FAD-binding and (Fe-S)-binding domain-containing protein [Microvirga lenta]MCB5177327.1 FAD-binding oxidoreductase [Microvirga lenta]
MLKTDSRRSLQERRRRWTPGGRIKSASIPAPDPDALVHELKAAIQGEVRFSNGDRALYATDASNYRQVPIGVVVPKTTEDVVKAVEVCRRHEAPLVARGGGTSLAGQTCNTAVVIDFSKYLNRILELDPERRRARVEPGCILDALRDAAERHHLTFGPDPATHSHNTLGGMIGNNSCGVHSVQAGRTADNVEALDILTYDGLRLSVGPTSDSELRSILAAGGRRAEIYRSLDAFRRRYADLIRERFPKIPRRVSGYADLDKLLPENGFDIAKALVGTEGTCVTVLGATLALVPSPRERVLVIIGFPDIFQAADMVPRILEHEPLAVEGIDHFLVDSMLRKHLHESDMNLLPQGCDWLVVEFGGETEEEAAEKGRRLVAQFEALPHAEAKLICRDEAEERIWAVRRAGLPGSAYVPDRPETWEGWEDTAVTPESLGDYLRDLKALFDKYGYISPMYGHFGDGLVHCRVSFDLDSEEGIETWRRFLDEAADLVVRYGGSLSGEHGDGQSRADLLEKMYGPELIQAFREFKAIWDPQGRMNPGKIVDPYPITSNLRLGPSYRPPKLDTHFHFEEEGGFQGAVERCVGVGKCRRHDSKDQVMCPSYLVTHEEKSSTRGRARMLFEMLHGGPLTKGWRSDEVEDALKLCLACKGCKSDCPVNVDMATYKAEFRAHYYKRRLRPRSAYTMGLIYWWARLGSKTPRLANLTTQMPLLRNVTKALGGIHQQRTMPAFAHQTFTDWFRRRRNPPTDRPRVLLWPDTFNNFFRPETAIAATRVLEAMGYEVTIPDRPLCCGRPLYDQGMLPTAKRLWRQTMRTLHVEIEDGTPIVGLEPACVAAFKDELTGLFPDDPRARRLKEQTVFFSDFLCQQAEELNVARGGGRAYVQIHCNQHAVIKTEGERHLLDSLGLDYRFLPSGCCGMAGAFGFAAETYDVGLAAGERVLLPMVREADEDVLILANGFSCREQIEQGTGRQTLHVAELVEKFCDL